MLGKKDWHTLAGQFLTQSFNALGPPNKSSNCYSSAFHFLAKKDLMPRCPGTILSFAFLAPAFAGSFLGGTPALPCDWLDALVAGAAGCTACSASCSAGAAASCSTPSFSCTAGTGQAPLCGCPDKCQNLWKRGAILCTHSAAVGRL